MILSSTDKYFYSFVKIDIDSKTEKVLESGILTDINSLYSFYKDKHAYNKSLIYQIDEVKSHYQCLYII